MTDKPLYPLKLAREQAQHIVDLLSPACERIQIAGSIRRRRPQVHDIDLVLWPKVVKVPTEQLTLFGEPETILSPAPLLALLRELGWEYDELEKFYPRKLTFTPPEDDPDGQTILPLELYLTEADGANFGALLQMRTGSEEFNKSLVKRASRLGLYYQAGYGIFKSLSQRVDDGSEDGIFHSLGIEPILPEYRNCDFHYITRKAKV